MTTLTMRMYNSMQRQFDRLFGENKEDPGVMACISPGPSRTTTRLIRITSSGNLARFR